MFHRRAEPFEVGRAIGVNEMGSWRYTLSVINDAGKEHNVVGRVFGVGVRLLLRNIRRLCFMLSLPLDGILVTGRPVSRL